jgi:prevent-host-death family protein
MIKVNIHEAKAQLSRLLARIRAGERVIVCRRNVPVAELVPLPMPRTRGRPIGRAKGRFKVPPSFFDPLPNDVVSGFEGGSA